MADNTTTDLAAAAPQGPKRPWGAEDTRILMITFVGGLAANIGLVLILGLGLAIIHLLHKVPTRHGAYFSWQSVLLVVVPMLVIGTLMGVGMAVRSYRKGRKRFGRLFLVGAGVYAVFPVLVLVGLAAGIK